MLSFLLRREKKEPERREGRRKGAEKTSKTHGGTHSVATALSEGEERDTEKRLRESRGRAYRCLDLPPRSTFTAVKWALEGGRQFFKQREKRPSTSSPRVNVGRRHKGTLILQRGQGQPREREASLPQPRFPSSGSWLVMPCEAHAMGFLTFKMPSERSLRQI